MDVRRASHAASCHLCCAHSGQGDRAGAVGGRVEAREGEKETFVINTYRHQSAGSIGCESRWETLTHNLLLTAEVSNKGRKKGEKM